MKLTPLKQPSGKVIHAWAFEGDCLPETLASNTCTIAVAAQEREVH